jgi:hypothetical protein
VRRGECGIGVPSLFFWVGLGPVLACCRHCVVVCHGFMISLTANLIDKEVTHEYALRYVLRCCHAAQFAVLHVGESDLDDAAVVGFHGWPFKKIPGQR